MRHAVRTAMAAVMGRPYYTAHKVPSHLPSPAFCGSAAASQWWGPFLSPHCSFTVRLLAPPCACAAAGLRGDLNSCRLQLRPHSSSGGRQRDQRPGLPPAAQADAALHPGRGQPRRLLLRWGLQDGHNHKGTEGEPCGGLGCGPTQDGVLCACGARVCEDACVQETWKHDAPSGGSQQCHGMLDSFNRFPPRLAYCLLCHAALCCVRVLLPAELR